MKIYPKIIKIISNIIFLVVIVLTVIAYTYDNSINEAPIGSFETTTFNEGWVMKKEGKTENIVLPYSGSDFLNKEVILTNTLPDYIKDGMELCFRSDLTDIKIYVGNELRIEFGSEKVKHVGYYPPSAYEFVALNGEDAGKEIRIELLIKKSTGKFESITIGFGNNSWFDIISNNILEISMAILMIFIGFIAMIFYFVVKKKIQANRSILFLSQTIIMLGVWTISESRLRQLIFDMPSMTQIFCYLSLEVLAVFVLFYFDEIQNNRYHKPYLVLQTINLFQLLANISLAYFRVADLHDTLRYSHICIGISFVPIVCFLVLDVISGKIKKYRISALGMFAFLIAALGELIFYYVSSAQSLGFFLCVGLVLLLGATVTQTLVDAYSKEIESRRHVEKATITTIETIASAIDARDKYTGGHSERVAYYATLLAKKVAKEYNYDESDIKRIHYIALMHDIGKIGIPDAILNKPGKLTDEEYALMKEHAVIGDNLLKDVDTIEGLSDGVRYHHERYDGKGYPDGLAGDDIPKVAKILCVADSFDAMTSTRIYRKRLSDVQVREELERCSGTQFDPMLIKAFCELIDARRLVVQPQKAMEQLKVNS